MWSECINDFSKHLLSTYCVLSPAPSLRDTERRLAQEAHRLAQGGQGGKDIQGVHRATRALCMETTSKQSPGLVESLGKSAGRPHLALFGVEPWPVGVEMIG